VADVLAPTGQRVKIDAGGHGLTDVRAIAPPADTPASTLPLGMFDFKVHDVAPGGAATVRVILPAGFNAPNWLIQDPRTGWLQRFDFNGATGAQISGNVVTLHFVDGGRGDADGIANGVIADPGGPGGLQAIDQQATTDEDSPINIYWLTYNDTDPNLNSLSVVAVGQAAHGTAVLQADGTVTYTPNLHWSGSDNFTYTISNGTDTATANVAVTVNPIDYAPVAAPVNVATNQNTAAPVTFSATDVESNQFTYSIVSGPANGTLSDVNGNQVVYMPNGNFSGADSFTYSADDGQGSSDAATVSVTVNPVAQLPGVTITESGGSTAVEEPGLTADISTDSYTAVLNTQPTADVVLGINAGSELQTSAATLTFTSSNWSVPQTVTVQAVDDQIVQASTHTATIIHTVTSADLTYNNIGVAGVPVAIREGDFAGIDLEGVTTGDLQELTGSTATWTVALTSQPSANVTLSLTLSGQSATLSTSALTFTPGNWNTSQTVTATVINDGVADGYHQLSIAHAASSADPNYNGLSQSISYNVVDANGPNALPGEATTFDDTPVTVGVLANDIDAHGDPLTLIAVTQPANGSVAVNPDGSLTYTGNAQWTGDDSFTYTIADPAGHTDTATATVHVLPDEDVPDVVNPGTQTNAEDDAVSVQINATDAHTAGFIYSVAGLPPGLTIDPMTGKIWGWIDPTAAGTYNTQVTVDDMAGGVTTVNFTWNVANTNHPPHLMRSRDAWNTVGDSVSRTAPIGTDIDIDALTYSMTGLPTGLTFNALSHSISGTVTAAGTYNVTYTVTDPSGAADSDSFIWHVVPQNASAPDAEVYFGSPYLTADNGSGNSLGLTFPATPLYATVVMHNPGDPNTAVPVSLVITPGGRSLLSTSTLSLRDGQSATVVVTPAAISQKPQDVVIRAYVNGGETSRDTMTNVGVVLPYHVRAEDTPQGMKDRIALVGGGIIGSTGSPPAAYTATTWGGYTGTAIVAPNLMGIQQIGFGIQRPSDDDKYGNAIVDPNDISRFSRVSKGIINIIGTVQTQPSLGPDGNPDGLARNADQLFLVAYVPQINVLGLVRGQKPMNVAAIPTATQYAWAANIVADNEHKWQWGLKFSVTFSSDGGELKGVYYSEDLERVAGRKSPCPEFQNAVMDSSEADWQEIAGAQHYDENAFGPTPAVVPKRADAVSQMQALARKYASLAYAFLYQIHRYYVSSVERKPALKDGHIIDKSGYSLRIGLDLAGAASTPVLMVYRYPKAVRGANEGLIDDQWRKLNENGGVNIE
jgi:hypothetical protein